MGRGGGGGGLRFQEQMCSIDTCLYQQATNNILAVVIVVIVPIVFDVGCTSTDFV